MSPSTLSCSSRTVSATPPRRSCGRQSTALGASSVLLLPLSSIADQRCSNHVPWIIIAICYTVCPIIMLIIRRLLARENARRDAEPADDTYDNIYVEVVLPDGKRVDRKVAKVRLLSFRFIQTRLTNVPLCRNSWT